MHHIKLSTVLLLLLYVCDHYNNRENASALKSEPNQFLLE
jgi:hypothetical protein